MKQTPAYDIANDVILSLVPPNARRIIDVGCMVGAMAREVRTRSPHAEVVGLDIDPNYAAIAAQHCDPEAAVLDAIPFQYVFRCVPDVPS
jgi:trans-aconitate methyltransferase